MLLQSLCSRLGSPPAATSRSSPGSAIALAWRVANGCWRNCRSSPPTAEVLGAALAFHLLLGVSITTGVVLTAFDTLIVLACSAPTSAAWRP